MSERTPIDVLGGTTRKPITVTLVADVTLEEVQAADAAWVAFLAAAVRAAREQELPVEDLPEHSHWRWERKWRYATEASRFFGVEAEGEMQGLMAVRTDKTGRLPEQTSQPLIYVDYLSTAPWNDTGLAALTARTPRFRKVGSALMTTAIVWSRALGHDGRLGLHALPQAEAFYRDRCGMQDLGVDAAYEDLRYFEMTPRTAERFLGETHESDH